MNRNGVHVKAHFENFNSYDVEVPLSVVDELATYDEVEFLSPNATVTELGHLTLTSGADAVRSMLPAGSTATELDGTGIGIAIVDSGVFLSHKVFVDRAGTKVRVVLAKDFVGDKVTTDKFGHGTHVASIAAANGMVSGAAYAGIAPNASIINLRVLNNQGTGTTSSVLNALNWLVTYGNSYNVRVVNMSLGSPAINSYQNDPICKAVRKLVNLGVVVVAAAGNDGKNNSGQKMYGAIHSPGNEPSAITVGAANTFGTDSRSDDVITTYSSRGPTRSYWTDSASTKHYDNLVKPDLVAPGNKILAAEAKDCSLVTQYPLLDAGNSTDSSRKMMRLNGTSMAAPVVAGAAA